MYAHTIYPRSTQILRAGESTGENYIVLVHEAGGYEKLEKLQSHANEKIYQRAVNFIEKYLGVDEEEENAAPQTNLAGEPVMITDVNGQQQQVHATYGFPTGK